MKRLILHFLMLLIWEILQLEVRYLYLYKMIKKYVYTDKNKGMVVR